MGMVRVRASLRLHLTRLRPGHVRAADRRADY